MSEALARELGSRTLTMSAVDELPTDVAWYREHRASILKQYRGRFVAIAKRRVIDADEDFDALAERIFSRVPDRAVYMPLVADEIPVTRLRSPKRA